MYTRITPFEETLIVFLGDIDSNLKKFQQYSIFRADAARQKSEALRSLATQLIEEHDDYTKKNEKVFVIILIIILDITVIIIMLIVILILIVNLNCHGYD